VNQAEVVAQEAESVLGDELERRRGLPYSTPGDDGRTLAVTCERARVDVRLSQLELRDLREVVEHPVHEVLRLRLFAREEVPVARPIEGGEPAVAAALVVGEQRYANAGG